jgi:AcrR family transcriptional regulator
MSITLPTQAVTKHDRKLAKILAAAARVFAKEGYDRASIRMVAQQAHVSVPGLYHYVHSKEELLFLIQHHVFSDLVETCKAKSRHVSDPQLRLQLVVRSHLERFLANMAELVVCSREMDRLKGEYRRRIEAVQREYFRLVVRLFDELREHHGAANVEPRTAALALFGSINWIYTWYRPGTELSAADLAEKLVQLYLRGVLPRAGGALR